jgi:phospholipase C
MRRSVRESCAALIAAFAVTSCAGTSSGAIGTGQPPAPAAGNGSSRYVKHIVLMIQENRSFDNLFATFPGADGATQGKMKGVGYVTLKKVNLSWPCDFGHSYNGFIKDYDKGKMDGFNYEGGGKKCPGPSGTLPYQYVDPQQIQPYWELAEQYVLADHLFQTQGSGSFTAHQDLIAGGTTFDQAKTHTVIDYPSAKPWGCDAPAGTVTSQIVSTPNGLKYQYHKGPFTCFTYATLRDLLDAKAIPWLYYSPPEPHGEGSLWNGFDAIAAVRQGSEWTTNVKLQKAIFNDISGGTLPAVSWVVPDARDSDHPGSNSRSGPSWIASVVNAIGESSYWPSTVIVVVWDDWGGFYDHEPPPFFDKWGGLGFRVPMLVVSAYTRTGQSSQGGYISHTQYEFGSILRFIEQTFALGQLGTTDTRATSILNCFDFSQQPHPFKRISAKYPRSYFERMPPSNMPVDTQ